MWIIQNICYAILTPVLLLATSTHALFGWPERDGVLRLAHPKNRERMNDFINRTLNP